MSIWWGSLVVSVSSVRNASREALSAEGSVWLPCVFAIEIFEKNETRIREREGCVAGVEKPPRIFLDGVLLCFWHFCLYLLGGAAE